MSLNAFFECLILGFVMPGNGGIHGGHRIFQIHGLAARKSS